MESTNENGLSTDLAALKEDYWRSFGTFLQSRGSPLKPPKPSRANFVAWGVGRTGFTVAANVNARDGRIGVWINLLGKPEVEASFSELKSQQADLERDTGCELAFEVTGKERKIATYRSADLTRRETWSDAHDWMLRMLSSFDLAFRPRIGLLDPARWSAESAGSDGLDAEFEPRVRDILRVLCRTGCSRAQLVLYALALSSPDIGVTSTALRDALAFDAHQHRGVMSSLAKRVRDTPRELVGVTPEFRLMFHQRWNGEQNIYRPRPELLEAITRVPELAATLARPIGEVVAGGVHRFKLPEGVDPKPVPPLVEAGPANTPLPLPSSFEGFLRDLDQAGLVYPSELVANLVLALQVKRFVILTGISGSGKTQIGKALAARYPVMRSAAPFDDLDDRAFAITVQPYMIQHHQIVVPVALAAQLEAQFRARGSHTIRVRWPGGELSASAYRRRAFMIQTKGELRTWFEKTFRQGDTVLLRADGPADGPQDGLVLEAPDTKSVPRVKVENAITIAVRPDWTDHRGLLGYRHPIDKRYMLTPFLRLLLRAADEEARAIEEKRDPAPFFAILDEMNLARVEHYFADFLSALESGEPLRLHEVPAIAAGKGVGDEGLAVPERISIPRNLFFIGTVNVDESTYLFSPKVLDRAFAIELDAVNLDALVSRPVQPSELDLHRWSGQLPPPTAPSRADWQWLVKWEKGALAEPVSAMHRVLELHHRHFGYRVVTEVARFVRLAAEQADDPLEAAWAALDLAVLQKILVKLHGTESELADVIRELLAVTLAGSSLDQSQADPARYRLDTATRQVVSIGGEDDELPLLPRSAAKLWRMGERLRQQGFASWIE